MSIVIVLDQPQDLVNIAHVVRGMKNFGFKDLRLVQPREYDAYRVEGIAHQTGDVLARVRSFGSLDEGLAGCVHVVGLTARGRTAKRNQQRPREAGAEITALAEDGLVALLFGREDKGLSNEALDRCHRVVTIPSEASYAAIIMMYELALAGGAGDRPFKAPRRVSEPAPVEEVERLFADVQRALEAIDFFKTRNAEGIMRTMRELVHRTPLDLREVKLLRAMAIEVVKYGERLARTGLHVDGQ